MNTQSWLGITFAGVSILTLGIGGFMPILFASDDIAYAAPVQEDIFLLAAGIVLCLIGVLGMSGTFKQTHELVR